MLFRSVAEVSGDGVVKGGSIGGKVQLNLDEVLRVVHEAVVAREADYENDALFYETPRIKDGVRRAKKPSSQ